MKLYENRGNPEYNILVWPMILENVNNNVIPNENATPKEYVFTF